MEIEDDFIKKGVMEKSPLKMSVNELKKWELIMAMGIKKHLFSIGQPLVYRKNDKLVAEYADGTVSIL